ncbi:hypothetical protein MBUL_03805 [Methylobacterium bullatum]|uniref:Uncharacterized protein n=1 Tax=Methylobacterium bullatum TaxID=570505 RepID=A0A679JKE5_9HYPH|nr:hypothetical protein MBUL_03805 [Methylobacterium bullatum]
MQARPARMRAARRPMRDRRRRDRTRPSQRWSGRHVRPRFRHVRTWRSPPRGHRPTNRSDREVRRPPERSTSSIAQTRTFPDDFFPTGRLPGAGRHARVPRRRLSRRLALALLCRPAVPALPRPALGHGRDLPVQGRDQRRALRPPHRGGGAEPSDREREPPRLHRLRSRSGRCAGLLHRPGLRNRLRPREHEGRRQPDSGLPRPLQRRCARRRERRERPDDGGEAPAQPQLFRHGRQRDRGGGGGVRDHPRRHRHLSVVAAREGGGKGEVW